MSLNLDPKTLKRAVNFLKKGGVIGYPTEGVYGIGCDPMNQRAVERLLTLKKRPPDIGLILIAASWEQIQDLIDLTDSLDLDAILATWPGPFTWILPSNDKVPLWITGKHATVAVRVTDHPQAKALCEEFGGPLVSTSANIHGHHPARDNIQVYRHFGETLDYILPGRVGDRTQPTEIRDGLSGEVIRAG